MNKEFNTWITSDLHFRHGNILKFYPATRPFKSVSEMDQQMISLWNQEVGEQDLVYILGDLAFTSAPDAVRILQQLKGRKILVEGNHDRKNLRDPSFRACFEQVHQYLEINYQGNHICMFHYPVAEFNRQHHGSIHFYGHLHGKPSGIERYRARDVGFDATGRVVWNMDDAVASALKGEIKLHHS